MQAALDGAASGQASRDGAIVLAMSTLRRPLYQPVTNSYADYYEHILEYVGDKAAQTCPALPLSLVTTLMRDDFM